MALQNGIGIASVPYRMTRQVEGQPHGAPGGPRRDMPYENPLLAQVATCTVGSTSDVSDEIAAGQVVTATFTDPDGVVYTASHTVTADENTAGTDADGIALMADIIADMINAEETLANIVEAEAAAAVTTVRWLHPDPRGNWGFSVSIAAAAAETPLTTTEVAASQSTGGTVIPMGRFLAYRTPVTGGRRRGGLPNAATDRIAAVALRDPTQYRGTSQLATATNDYPVGCVMTARELGQVSVRNVSEVAAVAGDPVYTVISTTGGDALGQARCDRDGTADVWTATPTAANATAYALEVRFPEWDGEPAESFLLGDITSDGSATQTEISDAFKTLAATTPYARLLELVSLNATGVATIVFTGRQLGRPFVVADAAEAGDWASITHTTTAAQYTKLVQGARWDEDTAAGAVGKIYVNF